MGTRTNLDDAATVIIWVRGRPFYQTGVVVVAGVSVSDLPSQAGFAGYFLTTDGSNLSWGIPAGATGATGPAGPQGATGPGFSSPIQTSMTGLSGVDLTLVNGRLTAKSHPINGGNATCIFPGVSPMLGFNASMVSIAGSAEAGVVQICAGTVISNPSGIMLTIGYPSGILYPSGSVAQFHPADEITGSLFNNFVNSNRRWMTAGPTSANLHFEGVGGAGGLAAGQTYSFNWQVRGFGA